MKKLNWFNLILALILNKIAIIYKITILHRVKGF